MRFSISTRRTGGSSACPPSIATSAHGGRRAAGLPRHPRPIVIDEALEIARRYSAPESIDFLNGVLDAIAKSRQ